MHTIITIDDDAIVRQSLETILTAQHLKVLASGASASEAVSLYRQYNPDILLLDIRLGDSTGIDAAGTILSEFNEAKILLLTTFHDKEYIDAAIKLGVKGYILKENISSISSAIDAVLSENIVFDSKIISELSTNSVANKSVDISELSERENEVLQLIAEGKNNKEIAQEMFLSEGTVRNYISIMLSKLELRDRTQLAVYYYKKK